MPNAIRLLSLFLLTGLAACSGGADALRTTLAPTQGASSLPNTSGCYSVKFKTITVLGGQPGIWTGQVSGDLQGSTTVVFDPGQQTPFTGVTNTSGGTITWNITGGIIPGLGVFETRFENRNFLVDRPGSPGTVVENQGRHRALGGVAKANLTYKGSVEFPPPIVDHDYEGVICR